MAEDFRFETVFFESLYRRDTKDVRVIEILGHLYTSGGRIEDGLKMDRRLVRIRPEDPNAHYNLACSLALKKRKREAVLSLRRAIQLGYSDFDWLRTDNDLKSLHRYAPFLDLLAEIE